MSKEIQLTQGKVALVDDENFESLTKYKWHYHRGRRCEYARRSIWVNGKCKTIYMHQLIMNTPSGM